MKGKLFGIGALMTVIVVALGLQPIVATAADTYTIFNVDKDLTDDPHLPHVKRFWTYRLEDDRFVPVEGEWTEGWANLSLKKVSANAKPSQLHPGPKAFKQSPNRALWEEAVKTDLPLPVDLYTGTLYVLHGTYDAPEWQKHTVTIQVVHFNEKDSRAILKYAHATAAKDHGACTHGDN